ncbi:hypothetical protein AYO46_10935 [Betaproteobacteria bacterium SCGC AG-212-J23]|nr:hypothetical protein AYO46_10935 [Betaproteobacteria bacterium SCGC AG-212-J23]
MRSAALFLALLAGSAHADDRDTQRAVLQRDQQSAEFAAGERRGELETLHQRQQLEMSVNPQPADYLRGRMAQDREQLLQRPLPLPGGRPARLEAIPLKGFGG